MVLRIDSHKVLMSFMNSIATLLFFLLYQLSKDQSITTVTIIGIIQYTWMIVTWYLITKSTMNVYLFFLILSFFFYMGQPVLNMFNVDVTSIMSIKTSPFTETDVKSTLVFLLKAMMLFHFGASFSINKKEVTNEKTINMKAMVFVGSMLFAVSFIPQMSFTYSSMKTTLSVGYSGIFQSDFVQGAGIDGGIPRFLSIYFKVSLLLLILGNKNNKKMFKFWLGFASCFSVIMIISGQRGSNALFILSLVLLYHYAIKPFTNIQIFRFFAYSISGLVIFNIISAIRNIGISRYSFDEVSSILSRGNFFTEALGEMGFTLLACTTVMYYSPSVIPFNDGATYFNSLFALIPNLFWDVNPAAIGGVDQVFKSFLMYNSGIGSSFIIEAYYNFGMYGLCMMPLYGFLVGKLHFVMVRSSQEKDYIKLFICLYLTTIVLWFVRSETINFWRIFGYYTILPVIMIYIVTPSSKNKLYNMENVNQYIKH